MEQLKGRAATLDLVRLSTYCYQLPFDALLGTRSVGYAPLLLFAAKPIKLGAFLFQSLSFAGCVRQLRLQLKFTLVQFM